ncbi:MAG: ROK family protein [Bacteroidales bacterium]|nr:ROK family protein [Bacteroidales bacterium]
MVKQVVLGVDIGGTNTTFALVDKEGRISFKDNIPTRQYSDARNLVRKIKESLGAELLANDRLMGVGVGAPNGNFYNGTIEFAPNLQWTGIIPLARYFQEEFKAPSYLTNDANAAAVGEMIFGNTKNIKDFIMVTLGTGLGSGIVVNGQILYGHDGFAGELGHVIVKENGRQCGCGRKGCLETYASVTGIKTTVVELLESSNIESELRGFKVVDLSGKIIEQAAVNGDEIAQKAFGITGEYLGKALANIIAITSPKAIVLFGGLAQSGDLIFKPTEYFMNKNLLKIYEKKVKLIPSALKSNEAALLGAAALAWKETANK